MWSVTTRPSTASPRNSRRSFDRIPACSEHHERCATARRSSSGSAKSQPIRPASEASAWSCSGKSGADVVDGVAHGLQVLEVFVLDPEADGALAHLLFDGLDELDECEGICLEVVDERLAFGDLARLDLEDVGEPVSDELEDLCAVHRTLFDVGLCGHEPNHTDSGGRYRGTQVTDQVALDHLLRDSDSVHDRSGR